MPDFNEPMDRCEKCGDYFPVSDWTICPKCSKELAETIAAQRRIRAEQHPPVPDPEPSVYAEPSCENGWPHVTNGETGRCIWCGELT